MLIINSKNNTKSEIIKKIVPPLDLDIIQVDILVRTYLESFYPVILDQYKQYVYKTFGPTEVKEAIGILDEASRIFQCAGFSLVREPIEKTILANDYKFLDAVIRGRPVRKYVYSSISNISGNMLEGGQYHVYRGVLGIVGEELLKIFDSATDELLRLGDCDKKFAENQKNVIRENIKMVG
jgi:hypothetical protein